MTRSARGRRHLIGALASLSLSCATLPGGQDCVRTELYFGTQVKGGGTVSESDWIAFLADVVTPRFPQGLTVLEGAGQWQGQAGPVREQTHILILLQPLTTGNNEAIEQIRKAYKDRFHQDSVMRVTEHARVDY